MNANVIPFRKKPWKEVRNNMLAELYGICSADGEFGMIVYEIYSRMSEEDFAIYARVEQKVAEQMAERRRAGARKAAATRKRRREEQKAS